MEDLDALAPHFRQAKERWPEAPTLSNHYDAISDSFDGAGLGIIATVKSFIECVCLTILGEFGRLMPSSDPSTTELLGEALKLLGLQNSHGASKVDKLLSAHNRLADALSELRNQSDPVAHGKDGFLDTLTINERRAFLVTGDTILALLLSAHDGTEPDVQYTREPYERFAHLHERVDRSVTVESSIEDDEERQLVILTLRSASLPEGVELRIEPSRLLYAIDRAAYVELLASSTVQPEAATLINEEARVSSAAIEDQPASEPATAKPEVVSLYQGILSPLKEALSQYLASLAISVTVDAPTSANVLDSLLATAEQRMGVDWSTRQTLLAGMKVALRRTLVHFGVDQVHAEESAEHLTTWFKIQAAGLTNTESAQSDG